MKNSVIENIVLKYAEKLKALDDACPDVGMGPSFNFFIEKACEELDLNINQATLFKKWQDDYMKKLTLKYKYGRIK